MKQVLLLLFLCATTLFAQQFVPGKLTVILREQALQGMIRNANGTATLPNAASLNALNALHGVSVMKPLSRKIGSAFRGYFEFQIPENANLQALKTAYEANPLVRAADPIPTEVTPLCGPFYPNDPKFSSLWHLDASNDVDINASEAWEWTKGNPNVIIAVCGGYVSISTTYPNEYSPDVASNVWTNPGEIPGNGVDDDGNGFVDDLHGWDFWRNSPNIEGLPGDDRGHGTRCALNAIAAIDNSNLLYSGIGSAPECKFMCLPAASIPSIIYATENGATVFSFSFAAGGSVWNNAVTDAYNMGMLFCNAAGNPNTGIYDFPPYGISVKHIDQNAVPYPLTGPQIDIATPSTDVASSFAAPIVAGVVDLMKTINPICMRVNYVPSFLTQHP